MIIFVIKKLISAILFDFVYLFQLFVHYMAGCLQSFRTAANMDTEIHAEASYSSSSRW